MVAVEAKSQFSLCAVDFSRDEELEQVMMEQGYTRQVSWLVGGGKPAALEGRVGRETN